MRNIFLIPAIFSTLILQAQDPKEILSKSIQAVNTIEQGSYHIDIQQTNILSGDTSKLSAECLLKRMPEDTLARMYYYFSVGNSGFYKYNGTAYYSYTPEYYTFILRYSVKENPEKFRSVNLPEGVSPPEVTSLFYYTYSLFNSVRELQSLLDEINSALTINQLKFVFQKDTLVDNIRCFGFKIIKPRKNFSYNKLILIDQGSYLPMAVIKDFRGGSLSVSREKISVGQYSSIKYSKIRESIPRFDYLMSDKSLPKKVEVTDHIPFAEPFKLGDKAPAWQLPEVNTDKLISSDSLSGSIIVLDFTSTWCIHCVEGALVINDLHQKYGDRRDVIFINVFSSSSDMQDKVQKYIRQRKLEGRSVYKASDIEKPYGIMGYPNFFLIDRHGRIAYLQRGYSPNLQKILSTQIDDCLGKK